MITRAFAARYDRRAGSGRNDPLRVTVETSDGEEHEVFLKVSGSPELSVSGLAAEALAACIAGQVGLPVCRPFLVELSPEWVATIIDPETRGLLGTSNGVAFGSKAAGAGWKLWGSEDALTAARRQTALEILAFDAFTENPDRKPSNPNLLVKGDEFRLIDHELSLKVRGIIPPPRPWLDGGMNWLTGPDNHVFLGRLKDNDLAFDAVATAWSALSDDRLSDYQASLPMEWNEATDFIEAALSHVRTVRDRIDGCLAELRRILG